MGPLLIKLWTTLDEADIGAHFIVNYRISAQVPYSMVLIKTAPGEWMTPRKRARTYSTRIVVSTMDSITERFDKQCVWWLF